LISQISKEDYTDYGMISQIRNVPSPSPINGEGGIVRFSWSKVDQQVVRNLFLIGFASLEGLQTSVSEGAFDLNSRQKFF
jgi:hypothetical protein